MLGMIPLLRHSWNNLANSFASSGAACFKTLAGIESGLFAFMMSNFCRIFYFLWPKHNLLQGCTCLPVHMGDWLFIFCSRIVDFSAKMSAKHSALSVEVMKV